MCIRDSSWRVPNLMRKGVRRILVRGVNAPLSPEANFFLKIWLRNGAFWSISQYLDKYVVSMAPFSTHACSFCMFSLFNFSSIFPGGVSWPHLPLCADAHADELFCRHSTWADYRTSVCLKSKKCKKAKIYHFRPTCLLLHTRIMAQERNFCFGIKY